MNCLPYQDQAETLEHNNYLESGFIGATPLLRPSLRLKRTRIILADSNLTWSGCVAISRGLGYKWLLTVFENPVACLQRALGSQMKEIPVALQDLFPGSGCV